MANQFPTTPTTPTTSTPGYSNIDTVAQAVIQMEGSLLPGSVNMSMVQKFGLWNVGHLIWANQYGAVPVQFSPTTRAWAGWPSQPDAYAGLVRDLAAKARAGYTIRQAFEKYAPPSENNTEAYIQFVSQQTGYPDSSLLSSVLASSPSLPGILSPDPGNVGTHPSSPEDSSLLSSFSPLSLLDSGSGSTLTLPLILTALGLGAAVLLSTLFPRSGH